MSATALVSIVIPAWKPRVDWLRAAVQSALAQQEVQLEVVLVDDGSPAPVADVFADIEDERLRHIRVDHGGVAHARNIGAAHSRGAFIRFADADDVLETRSSARLLRLAVESDGIAYGATAVCDEQLEPHAVKMSKLEGWIAHECLLYRFDVRHMSMLFPRAVIEAVGDWYPGLPQCEDWDYVLRALELAPVRGDPEIATFYRRHRNSLTANVVRGLDCESLVVERYFDRHPEQKGTRLEREARAKLLLVRARAHSATGIPRAERFRLIAEACRLHLGRSAEELLSEGFDAGRRRTARVVAGLRRWVP
jgi:glycosyltransferase involved in cell wall biosynthesis